MIIFRSFLSGDRRRGSRKERLRKKGNGITVVSSDSELNKGPERPLVSVIVPVYNAEAFLERTFRTVAAQTWRPMEIILVDDGSKDGSGALCRRLAGEAPEDLKVKVVSKPNGGLSSARNAGIGEASGELVGFVDSDDLIEPDMFENMVLAYTAHSRAGEERQDPRGSQESAADEAPSGVSYPLIVQTGRDEVKEDGSFLESVLLPPPEEEMLEPEDFLRGLLMYTGDSSFCTKLMPRKLFTEQGFFFAEGVLSEDFLLAMQMVPHTRGVLRIPSVGYHVVHRMGSLTRRRAQDSFSRAYVDIIRHADFTENEVVKEFPGLEKQARRFGLYQRMDYLLHVPIGDMNAENRFYGETLAYLRKHVRDILGIEGLTAKNRVYLLLFAAAPLLVRKVHRMLMRLRQRG